MASDTVTMFKSPKTTVAGIAAILTVTILHFGLHAQKLLGIRTVEAQIIARFG